METKPPLKPLAVRRAEYRAECISKSVASYLAAGWDIAEAKSAAERAFPSRWVAMQIRR
jgi:hypothetical protein